MSAKIISVRGAVLWFALIFVAAGCTPAGPRALLKGRKYLDQGDYAAAAAQFKTATELLSTNAAAWNYLGVALQHAGQLDAAGTAYRHALEVNRDLLDARLNLGTLYLEQNQPDAAKPELTAYTLRRPNEAEGWLQLGSAQLKLNETVPAERSFSSVLALKTNEAEAYNGLGLARIQRDKPREAAQFFAAAVKMRADYAPAILNLATVDQEYLHDDQAALQNYRVYLALAPTAANADAVKAVINSLEQAAAPTTAPAPAPVVKPAAAVAEPPPKPKNVTPEKHRTSKPIESPRIREDKPIVHREEKPVVHQPPLQPATPHAPVQVVKVAPETQIVTTPKPAGPTEPPLEAPMPAPTSKPSVWSKLFGSSKPKSPPDSTYVANGLTPLPGTPATSPAAKAPETKQAPIVIVAPAPVNFPRYNYLSPRKPWPGNRRAADKAFAQARAAEQAQNWQEALLNYQRAATLDPSWFEAQYNAGVIAHRLREYPAALASYENALAIQPGSLDARYNFALALKAAGYVPDAANELKKILAASPDEVRAHLALANLYAQSLHDPVQARAHYKKVLQLDPTNPQAADIRFWLAANPN